MNKKVMLYWLSLVMLVATSAYAPAAPNRINSVNGNASPSLSNANSIQSSPQVRRVGLVVAYSPGQSITIVDRQGNRYRFELSSSLRVLPRHRATSLGRGSFVTVIASNNVSGGKQIAVGIVIHPSVPRGFETPVVPVAPTTPPPPTVTPPTVTPPTPIPPTPAPPPTGPVVPDFQPDIDVFATDRALSTIAGFTFPSSIDVGGVVPLEAAAFLDIEPPDSDGVTEVGMVSVIVESVATQFVVVIDVVSTSDIVAGQLVSVIGPDVVDVNFRRIPQIVNPDVQDAVYPEFQLDSVPNNIATITSDGVCFVVSTVVDTFTRYCSTSETLLSQPVERTMHVWVTDSTNTLSFSPLQAASPSSLSIMDSFPSQYEELQNMITAAATRINFQAPLALDQTLSTIQDTQRIQDCADAVGECASDIVAAPVPLNYFQQQYNERFDEDNGDDDDDDEDSGDDDDAGDNGDAEDATAAAASQMGRGQPWMTAGIAAEEDDEDDDPSQPTPIELGVVSVLQPIEFPTGIVQPGDYRLDAWFDTNGVFFAATLTGLTTADVQIVNQQIPAIPATFVDMNGNSPYAEIDRCCFWKICWGR